MNFGHTYDVAQPILCGVDFNRVARYRTTTINVSSK
jgi:hypothetical protein